MENLLVNNKIMVETKPILFQAKIHWISYVIPILFTAVGSVGFIPLLFTKGVGIIQIIALALVFLFIKGGVKLLNLYFTKIFITADHLSISSGFITSNVVDIPLNRIEGVFLTQNFLEKNLNCGSLLVTTGIVNLKYTIANPFELRKFIIK